MRTAVVTLDRRGKITRFGRGAEKVLGYEAREMEGRSFGEILDASPGGNGAVEALLARVHPETDLDANVRRKDGRVVPMIMNLHGLPANGHSADGSGGWNERILVLQDATERRKIEGQLERLDRLRSLDDSAAAIVHEIRNPLSAISTNAQYMIEKIRPRDPFFEEMQDILADVKTIENTVKTILDFAGKGETEAHRADLRDVVGEVLRLTRMQLRNQGIRLHREFDDNPVTGRINVPRMQQVFFNVVRNACQAMSGGGDLRIHVGRNGGKERQARVEVEDTGPGIPEGDLNRVFEPFY
ncbi:MAG: two-component system sensor histidine kinase NtrB, partial [Planctomycetota bacterium]